jgi:hypothetical protein
MDQLLLKKPELLVLDEPFLGLDAAAALEMKDRICALAREGKTIVLSGRWLWPAKDVCGRLAILFRGQIQAAGSPAQLLAAPDAIRIIGPVLPPANAERVLTTMRQEILGQAGAAMEPPKSPNRPTYAESRENSIFAALTRPGPVVEPERPVLNRVNAELQTPTRPGPAAAPEGAPAQSADPVNHEKLAQLTKERSEILGRPSD